MAATRAQPRGRCAEQLHRHRRQQIHLAEPAGHQEPQRLGRQFLDRHFARVRAHRDRAGRSPRRPSSWSGAACRAAPAGGYRCCRSCPTYSVVADARVGDHAIGPLRSCAPGRVHREQRDDRHRLPDRRTGYRSQVESAWLPSIHAPGQVVRRSPRRGRRPLAGALLQPASYGPCIANGHSPTATCMMCVDLTFHPARSL